MNKTMLEQLISTGEYIAAGYCELPEQSLLVRVSHGLRRYFELSPLPDWHGEPLYPTGVARLPVAPQAVTFSYSCGLMLDVPALESKIRSHESAATAQVLASLREVFKDLYVQGAAIPAEHSLGGGGYTHGIIDYGRILREGLGGCARRIEASGGVCSEEFQAAMTDLMDGIRTLVRRCAEMIRSRMRDFPELAEPGERLATALERVPEHPVGSFYEAMVAANLMWYIDGCDNFGRLDQDLGPYLDADLESGGITRDEALELVRVVWRNVNQNDGWNVTIGGTDRDGRCVCNTLTELCLEAARGSRRPNLALRVSRNMPDHIFDLALDSIASGCGLPALYNEEAYLDSVKEAFGCSNGDEYDFSFGGCTETMIHGCSNVGSIDGGISLLTVLDGTIRGRLAEAESFDAFLEAFIQDVRAEIARAVACVNQDQRLKASLQPQPIRTMFIGDCLESGLEYNSGGARYNGSVFNLGGLANVVDSLVVLRDLVFGGSITATEMIDALNSGFAGSDDLRAMIGRCPKFGNDDDRVDTLAARFAHAVFSAVRSHDSWRSGMPFLPSCIMFTVYGAAGSAVGATPDGRLAGEPISDSIGPVQGRDTHGPTAMLRSIAKLPLAQAIGTPVLNIRFALGSFSSLESRDKLKALIRGFFGLGGMQVQASVLDQTVLRDALEHPEKYTDLIVRIGGYSEYFNRLSPTLKLSVLQRTEHSG